jgi:MoaA/NifB/PqqE/SkfB family radical SAM enzyme
MFGHPLMVLTGGDPFKRPDLFNLIPKSVVLGCSVFFLDHDAARGPEGERE